MKTPEQLRQWRAKWRPVFIGAYVGPETVEFFYAPAWRRGQAETELRYMNNRRRDIAAARRAQANRPINRIRKWLGL